MDAILARLREEFPAAFVTFALPSVKAGLFRHEQALMLTWNGHRRRDVLQTRADVTTTFAIHAWQPWKPEDAEDPAGLALLDLGDELDRVLMVDSTWGGLAHDTRVGGGEIVGLDADGVAVSEMRTTFDVQFFHDLQDPSTYTETPEIDGGVQ